MKKIIAILVGLCLVTAAGAYSLYYRPFSETYTTEQLLPTETLATIRINHLQQRVEKFRTSRLGTAIAGIDIRNVMTALEAPAALIQEAEFAAARVYETLDSPWFDELFGQQVTLALLPTKINDFNQPSSEELSQALVFVLRPKHPAKFLDWMKQFITKDVEITSEDYDQWVVNHFELQPGVEVHYAVAGELAVVALHRHPVVRCLDTLKVPDASLAQNPDYQSVERELTGRPAQQVHGFLNLQELSRLAADVVLENSDDHPAYSLIENQISQIHGLYAAGYAAYDDGSMVLEQKVVFMYDRAVLKPQILRTLDIKPETGAMLTMLPQSTLGFSWQNTLDLKLYYDGLLKSGDIKPEDIASINTMLLEKAGVSIEDLVNSFGPQWGLALQNVRTGGFFPIPELGIFLQSSRPEIMVQMIQQAAGKSNLPIQIETYRSQPISYLQLPFGSDLSPAYAYINGYCIVAVNTKIIKSYIDTINDGQNITGSDAFKTVDKGLSDKNNQVAYIRLDQLLDRAPEIIQWGSSMAAMARPDMAGQIAPVVQQVVNPLADGLKMYKTIGFRSFFTADRIESQIYTAIDDTATDYTARK